MAVVSRLRVVGLAENELLIDADRNMRGAALAVLLDGRRHSQRVAVEPRDAVGGARRRLEFDIGYAERDSAETFRVGLITAQPVAPRRYDLDMIVARVEPELRVREL